MARFTAPPAILYSPQFMPFSLMAAKTQAPGELLADGRITIESHRLIALSGAAVVAFINAGGEVDDAPIYLKMAADTYESDVPEGIHNRTITELDESVTVLKWSQWRDANHEHMTAADGYAIVPGNSWGSELASAELKLLIAEGITLLLAHEVTAELPEPSIE